MPYGAFVRAYGFDLAGFLKKITKKVLRLVSMLALYYSLVGPINKNEMIKHRIELVNAENTKETHIPLLEAEFAGFA